MEWINNLDIDIPLIISHFTRICVAYLLALPIAYEKEKAARTAGLRTFPLVAVGSCAYMLLGQEILDGSESQARILYGLIAGIGFIGGGAILKQKGNVYGTATAASIWITGAIGSSVAWYRYEIAIVLSFITLATLTFGRIVKKNNGEIQDDENETTD